MNSLEHFVDLPARASPHGHTFPVRTNPALSRELGYFLRWPSCNHLLDPIRTGYTPSYPFLGRSSWPNSPCWGGGTENQVPVGVRRKALKSTCWALSLPARHEAGSAPSSSPNFGLPDGGTGLGHLPRHGAAVTMKAGLSDVLNLLSAAWHVNPDAPSLACMTAKLGARLALKANSWLDSKYKFMYDITCKKYNTEHITRRQACTSTISEKWRSSRG